MFDTFFSFSLQFYSLNVTFQCTTGAIIFLSRTRALWAVMVHWTWDFMFLSSHWRTILYQTSLWQNRMGSRLPEILIIRPPTLTQLLSVKCLCSLELKVSENNVDQWFSTFVNPIPYFPQHISKSRKWHTPKLRFKIPEVLRAECFSRFQLLNNAFTPPVVCD